MRICKFEYCRITTFRRRSYVVGQVLVYNPLSNEEMIRKIGLRTIQNISVRFFQSLKLEFSLLQTLQEASPESAGVHPELKVFTVLELLEALAAIDAQGIHAFPFASLKSLAM